MPDYLVHGRLEGDFTLTVGADSQEAAKRYVESLTPSEILTENTHTLTITSVELDDPPYRVAEGLLVAMGESELYSLFEGEPQAFIRLVGLADSANIDLSVIKRVMELPQTQPLWTIAKGRDLEHIPLGELISGDRSELKSIHYFSGWLVSENPAVGREEIQHFEDAQAMNLQAQNFVRQWGQTELISKAVEIFKEANGAHWWFNFRRLKEAAEQGHEDVLRFGAFLYLAYDQYPHDWENRGEVGGWRSFPEDENVVATRGMLFALASYLHPRINETRNLAHASEAC